MIKSFKTRIYPTLDQVKYFRQAFGMRRWTWNWAWNEYQKQPRGWMTLQKDLNHGPVIDPNYKWLTEINSMVRQETLKDLSRAISKWKNPKCKISKQPHYATRKTSPMSFRYGSMSNGVQYKSPHYISMRRVRGKKPMMIKCAERMTRLKQASKICETTISEKAGCFYIVITYEVKAKPRKLPSNRGKAGVDMGIKTPLTIYDGNEVIPVTIVDKLRKAERRTEILNRALSRKQVARNKCSKGLRRDSKRYIELKIRLQKAYQHETNIKRNWREQWSWYLVSHYSVINIEPYTMQSADNIKCSRAARRAGGYEFYKRLRHKADEYGTLINEINWEPTTQTCSECGYRHTGEDKLTLSDRVFRCPECGFEWDRDANAARNIYNII